MIRRMTSGSLTALFIAWALVPFPAAAPAVGSCANLASTSLPDTKITSAAEVRAPSFTPPGSPAISGLPPFCRVAGVTQPAVNFEVWLPLNDWNGKFQGVGNGANAGSIGYGAMATALRRGYATASTDTGHTTTNARDGAWAVGHPELLVDFGYRAIHVTAENAKRVNAECPICLHPQHFLEQLVPFRTIRTTDLVHVSVTDRADKDGQHYHNPPATLIRIGDDGGVVAATHT